MVFLKACALGKLHFEGSIYLKAESVASSGARLKSAMPRATCKHVFDRAAVQDCMCICFDVTATETYVDAAFFGEMGYELLLFTPMVHHYHTLGKLRKTAGPLGKHIQQVRDNRGRLSGREQEK